MGHGEMLSRSDIIAVIIGGVTIIINLLAINHLWGCYKRRKLALENRATGTTASYPSNATHQESHPHWGLENGLAAGSPYHLPVVQNMQRAAPGAPNVQLVIPPYRAPLPQRPPAALLKLGDEVGPDVHGISLEDRAPLASRQHQAIHAEQ